MLTAEERHTYIATIATFPDDMVQLVSSLTEEQLTTPYLEGEWSVAQNVHHVVDSHMNSFIRLKFILTEERPPLQGYDQDAWAVLADGAYPQVEDSLMILRGLHRRWVRVWESLTDEQWARVGVHSEVGEITPDKLVKMYADHCTAHVDQVKRTLQAGGIAV
jgi:hypothetical protein